MSKFRVFFWDQMDPKSAVGELKVDFKDQGTHIQTNRMALPLQAVYNAFAQ